ncbi:MAG: glycosyltransferase [Thiotrichales bacterium]
MRIAQVMLGKGYGGAERAFVDTCLALDEAGHEVLAIIDEQFEAQEQLNNGCKITIAPIRILARWDPLARRQLNKILKVWQPEIAHVHLRRAMAVAGPTLKRSNIPFVASLHNYGNLTAYKNADGLIALTEGHRDYILGHAGFIRSHLKENAVTVIPNFSRFPESRKSIPEVEPLKFVAYGRFVPKKGFDLLIKAIALAAEELPSLRLTLIGDGPEKAKLVSLTTEMHLEDMITIDGWQQDLIPILDQHDIFVLPSRSEPFGIVLLEAMARGLGIISTRTEGPHEFLDDSCCEFAASTTAEGLAQAIIQVSGDRHSLKNKALKAQQRYSTNFSQTAVIKLLEQKYAKHLKG